MRIKPAQEQILTLNQLSKSNQSLSHVSAGDTLQGEIVDIKHHAILLKLLNGQVVNAKLSQQMEFQMGDRVTFEVKTVTDEQIELKPVLEQDYNPKSNRLSQVLQQAGLSTNPKNLELVETLMKHQMPIDKTFLQKALMLSHSFKSVPVEHLLILMKNDIPVNQDNLNQLSKWVNHQQDLGKAMAQLTEDCANISNTEMKEHLTSILSSTESKNASPSDLALSDNTLTLGKHFSTEELSHFEARINQSLKPFGHEIKLDSSTSFGELIHKLESMTIPDKLRQSLRHQMTSRLSDAFKEPMLLSPERLKNEEPVTEFFNKTYKKIIILLETLSTYPEQEGSALTKQASLIKQNLSFNHAINQNYTFVELPVLIHNQVMDSQLYVFQKKDTLKTKNPNQRVTALLRLDCAALKHLDIFVAKQDKSIVCQFYVEDKELKDFFAGHLEKLHGIINSSGLHVQELSVQVSKETFDPIKDFLDKDNDLEQKLQRYSFDMRV